VAVKFEDYYATLGVARTATPEEIKQAFRALARIHHPDVAKNKIQGEVKFKEINEAYEVLGDPEKRRRYDELGPNWQGGANGPVAPGSHHAQTRTRDGESEFEFSGTGFSDFFESFFGNRPDREAFAQAGRDVEADLLVTLEEALRGSQRKLTLRRPGHHDAPERTDTYQVRIPPGVHAGQRIRLAGQGGKGTGQGSAGDLYLRVRFAQHPDFSVQAADLHYDLDLAPWEAVLGVQAKIPTLDGPTSLRVPPGTAAGVQLRLRGLGLPLPDGTRGDLYATAQIRLPVTLSPEERTLWEQLAHVSPFKARDESRA
jgi:curved DNA-binding protein